MTFAARLGRSLLSLVLVVLAGGFAAATLVRYSPGFDLDENDWNPKIEAQTREALHARRESENKLPFFFARYLAAAVRGDLGRSDSFRVPVAELLLERVPVSARLIGWGTFGGLFLGCALAWLAVWPRSTSPGTAAAAVSGLLMAIPPSVLALAFFFADAPLALAVALALLPRVFGTARAIFQDLYASPSLLAARTRGLGPQVLAVRYVLGSGAARWAALAGVALVAAFGSIIPIEALCDVPGIGQLAWKAALARDLPLLSGLALLITFVVAFVHFLGELLSEGSV